MSDIKITGEASGDAAIDRLTSSVERLEASLSKLAVGNTALDKMQKQMAAMTKAMKSGFEQMIELQSSMEARSERQAALAGARRAAQDEASAERIVARAARAAERKIQQQIDFEQKQEALNNKSGAKALQIQVDFEAKQAALANKHNHKQIELQDTLHVKQIDGYVKFWEKVVAAQVAAENTQKAIQQKRDIEARDQQARAGATYVSQWEKMLAERQAVQERRDLEMHGLRQKEFVDYVHWWEKMLAEQTGKQAKQLELARAQQAALIAIRKAQMTSEVATPAAAAALRPALPAAAIGASSAGIAGHNDVMREGHSLARGLAGSLGGLWLTYGSLVPLAAGAALAASLKNVVSVGREVEQQLNFVLALSSTKEGVNLDQFLKITDSSLHSVVEAANAMRALAQNGLTATQSLQVLPSILDLATVGEMTVGQAAIAATGAVSAFGLSFSEAGRVGDIFAKTAAESNTSVLAITESMKQASTVASLFKVTIEETAGVLGVLAKINITGGAAGTSMTNMLTGLYEPTEKGKKALKELGVETATTSGALKPFTQLMDELRSSLSRFNDSAKVDLLGSIFTVRGVKSVQQVQENLDEYKKKVEEATNATGFMRSVVLQLEDSTTGAFARLGVAVERTFVTSFKEAGPYVQELGLHLADAFKEKGDVQNGITNLATNIARMTGALVEGLPAVVALAAAYGTLRLIAPIFAMWQAATAASVVATAATVASTAATEVQTVALGRGTATRALHTAAIEAQTVATVAGTAASAAWAAILLPALGALAVAIGVAAGLWLLFRDNTDAADQANTKIGNSLHVITEQLDKEIKQLKESNALWDARNVRYKSAGAVEPETLVAASNQVREIERQIRATGGDPEKVRNAVTTIDAGTGMSSVSYVHNLGEAYEEARANLAKLQEQHRRFTEEVAPAREKKNVYDTSASLAAEIEKYARQGSQTNTKGQLIETNEEVRALYRQVGALKTLLADGVLPDPKKELARADQIRASFKELMDDVNSKKAGRAAKPDKGAAAALNQEVAAYQTLVTSIGEKIAANKLLISDNDKLSDSQKMTIKLDEAIATGKKKLTPAHVAEARALLAILAAQEEVIESKKFYLDQAQAKLEASGAAIKAADDEADKLEELVATFGMTKGAIEALELARLKEQLAQADSSKGYTAEIAKLEALIDAKQRSAAAAGTLDRLEAAKKANAAELESEKKMWESIDKTAHDTFVSIFDSGKSAFDRLRDAIKNGLLDLLYQMTIKRWILSVSASVSGGASGLAQASEAGSSLDMLGNVASAGSSLLAGGGAAGSLGTGFAGSMYGGMTGAGAGSGLTSAAGLRLGQMTHSGLSGAAGATPYLGIAGGGLAAYGVAQQIGGVGGMAAGGLAGAGTVAAGGAAMGALGGTGAMAGATAALAAVPVWGWIAIAALAILGGMQDGPEEATRLMFGSNNKAGAISINERGNEGKNNEYVADVSSKGAFGSFGVISTFWMEAAQPAVTSFVQTVTQTDDALAAFMNSTEKAATIAALTGHTMTSNSGAEGSDPNGLKGLDAVFADRIKTILDTIDPALNKLLDGFKGDSQALAAEATALLDYRKNLPAVSKDIFGIVVTLQDLAALRTPTEAVGAALARVTNAFLATNAAIEPLGISTEQAFGAVGLASLAARQRLIDAAGGMDQLAAGASYFAQNFLTDAERLVPTVKALGERMTELGYAGVTTSDGYRDAVVALVSSGQVASAEGAKTYVELLKLAEVFSLVGAAGAEAAARAKALQDQIDELTMTKAQLLAKARTVDIVGMDAATIALYDRLAALKAVTQAEQDAATALQDMRDAAAGLLSGVDDAFSVLQRVVDREKAAKTAAHEIEMKALQTRIDATTDAIAKHKALSDAVKSTLEQMRMPGTEGAERTSAQAQIRAALAIARVGGPLPTADSVKGALATVSKDSTKLFTTMADYQRDFYTTLNDVTSLGTLADITLDVEEQALAVLIAQKDASQIAFDAEITRLDGIVEKAREEIELLKGMDISLLSIDQALKALLLSMTAASANPINGATASITGAYQTALGRAPDAAGLDFWKGQAANGGSISDIVSAISNSPEAKIQALYKSTLGRSADAGGLNFWMQQLQSGSSLASIKSAFEQSAEYRNKIPGFKLGGDHMGGLRMVGEIGPEVEATGASRIHSTRDLIDSLRNSNNDALVAELKAQRAENLEMKKMLEAHLYIIAKHAQTVADIQEKQEAIGVPAERAA